MQYNKITSIIKDFINAEEFTDEEKQRNIEIKRIFSFVVVFSSTFLTILNLINEYYIMALSTSALTLSFIICISLSSDVENIDVINIIMCIVIMLIFTYYAISGQNNGFAILWILLVPILGVIVLGIKYGLILSLYFQILLIVIFYTPLRSMMPIDYNETFKTRFPVLYFVGLSMSIYVMARNEKNKKDIKNALNFDKLTNLPNRDIYDYNTSTLDLCGKSLLLIKIKGLNYVNIELGHDVGNRLIKYASDYIRVLFTSNHEIYRIGDDMLAIIGEINVDDVKKLRKQINNYVFKYRENKVNSVSLEMGIAFFDELEIKTFKELEKIAFERLFQSYNK